MEDALGVHPQLQVLILSGNQFTGNIPALSIGSTVNLYRLDLSNNNMSGTIPKETNNLTKMGALDLHGNRFIGKIPPWFGSMVNLYQLDLSHNNMFGPIPEELNNLTQMSSLDLSFNSFTGTLVPDGRNKSQNLLLLPFSGFFISRLKSLVTLNLAGNHFSGDLPNFCPLNDLVALDLARNHFSGNLPGCLSYMPNIVFLNLAHNRFSGQIPILSSRNYCSLQHFLANNNSFTGELHNSHLQTCNSLQTLDLGENGFSGNIPTWLGDNSFPSLKILRLRSNKFSGNIPPQLSLLTSLQLLDLANNNLSGSILKSFGSLSQMALTQQQTHNLYNQGSWYLVSMSLNWKGMEVEFQTTVSLVKGLDLSNNMIFGEIPAELTNLHGLLYLNLSRNRLIGHIPNDVGDMQELESLDLSFNLFSGPIPTSISKMTFLSLLDLSYNNLSGMIPSSTQIQTLNASSFIGNEGLCGPPLDVECLTEDVPTSQSSDLEDEDEDEDDTVWYYIGIAPGVVTGFWGLIGILIVKKHWRFAYIRLIDSIQDWLFQLISK